MANKINKVVDRNGNVLIDLTNDTIKANKVLAGTTFHGPDGKEYTGSLPANELDTLKYNFIDYNGDLLYTYSDEELDALTELPAGPDHTDENLTFQSWNWSLEDLKAWNKERPDRPIIGANLITTDGKSYLYMDTPYSEASVSFSKSGKLNSVDWGDGTVDTNTSHTYANPGQYTIVIDMAEGGYWYLGSSSASTSTNKQWITKIKLGNMRPLSNYTFTNCTSLTSITIPDSVTSIGYSAFNNCYSLKSISIPDGVTLLDGQAFYGCYSLKSVSIPDGVSFSSHAFAYCSSLTSIIIPDSVTEIESSVFTNCVSLKSIIIPDGVTSTGTYAFSASSAITSVTLGNGITSIGDYTFHNCTSLTSVNIPDSVTKIGTNAFYTCRPLKSIIIPDSVTSIGSSAFSGSLSLTLDLSKQTKVISLTSSIGLNTSYNKILVPAALLDQYKSASYWSAYASCMVGV